MPDLEFFFGTGVDVFLAIGSIWLVIRLFMRITRESRKELKAKGNSTSGGDFNHYSSAGLLDDNSHNSDCGHGDGGCH